MKILIVGSGGREHAIAWKLAKSDRVEKLYCAPGNAGIAAAAECVPIKAEDLEGFFAKTDKLLNEHGVRMVIGISGDPALMPEFITRFAI